MRPRRRRGPDRGLKKMAAEPGTIRVFLLDDHEVVRRGAREPLETEPDITVVGEASTAAQALWSTPISRTQNGSRSATPR